MYLIVLKVVAYLASCCRRNRAGEIRFHHQVMSDDVDDIQSPRYRMGRRTFLNLYLVRGFAWAWMALRARSASRWLLAALNPQRTCHGPRPGSTLAPWCSGGLPACPGAEGTRKDPRPEDKKMPMCIKSTFLHSNINTTKKVALQRSR